MPKLRRSSSVLPVSCIEPSPPTIAVSTESKNVDGGDFGDWGAFRGPLLVRSNVGGLGGGLGGSLGGGLGGGSGRGRPGLCIREGGSSVGGGCLCCCGLVVSPTGDSDTLIYGVEDINVY